MDKWQLLGLAFTCVSLLMSLSILYDIWKRQ